MAARPPQSDSPPAVAGEQDQPSAQPAPPVQPAPDPAELLRWPITRSRDEMRAALEKLLNLPGAVPVETIRALFEPPGAPKAREGAIQWAEADLDGDGTQEFVLALPVNNPGSSEYSRGQGAALFVIYSRDGRYVVDRTEPMGEWDEVNLMTPALHAVADVAGLGHPQIIWSRPWQIATGPQPVSFFVTDWRPGEFVHLPGEMVIASGAKELARVVPETHEIILTGGSRSQMFMRTRTDRYRFVDGAFRLVDRHFVPESEIGYDRFWDGLVAEDVGHMADAERAYRDAAESDRQAHAGEVYQYKRDVIKLSGPELESFGQALRTFARFRLGALLLDLGRTAEAAQALQAAEGPYDGLLAAMRDTAIREAEGRQTEDREAGCAAAAEWAAANPEFLAALNQGVSHSRWTPELLCSHVPIDDSLRD